MAAWYSERGVGERGAAVEPPRSYSVAHKQPQSTSFLSMGRRRSRLPFPDKWKIATTGSGR